MSYAYLFKYIIIGDTGKRERETDKQANKQTNKQTNKQQRERKRKRETECPTTFKQQTNKYMTTHSGFVVVSPSTSLHLSIYIYIFGQEHVHTHTHKTHYIYERNPNYCARTTPPPPPGSLSNLVVVLVVVGLFDKRKKSRCRQSLFVVGRVVCFCLFVCMFSRHTFVFYFLEMKSTPHTQFQPKKK